LFPKAYAFLNELHGGITQLWSSFV
jgi:hypothetical protein